MRKSMMLLAIVATATPALARDKNKTEDPNRMICRTSDVIGSRLQTKRTCMTAQQWNELHQDQRNTVERVQSFKPVLGG